MSRRNRLRLLRDDRYYSADRQSDRKKPSHPPRSFIGKDGPRPEPTRLINDPVGEGIPLQVYRVQVVGVRLARPLGTLIELDPASHDNVQLRTDGLNARENPANVIGGLLVEVRRSRFRLESRLLRLQHLDTGGE